MGLFRSFFRELLILSKNMKQFFVEGGEVMTWYLKQLFPLTYRTTYMEDGKQHFTVWKMWFGRCYSIDDYIIG